MHVGGPKGDGPAGPRKGSLDATRTRGTGLLGSAFGLSDGQPLGSPAQIQLSEHVAEVQEVVERARREPEIRRDVVEHALQDLRDGRLVAAHRDLAALIARDLF